jgi:hypothetical protein
VAFGARHPNLSWSQTECNGMAQLLKASQEAAISAPALRQKLS